MSLSLNPPKWTADWIPEEFRLRKYIFDTRRTVCESFWYDEYLWPLVEDASIWEAKSGEDVMSELTKITNRNGEISSLAVRPEMTPTVTRMVSKYRREYSKPIKRFSLANFYRNEKPQRGRNREFRQLNIDVFGSDSSMAEIEMLQIWVEMMKAFGATSQMYEVRVNHRKLIDAFLENIVWLDQDIKQEAVRTMDKRNKLTREIFQETLQKKWCSAESCAQIIDFMEATTLDLLLEKFPTLSELEAVQELRTIFDYMNSFWYKDIVFFAPSLMRGFDYYDGMVFEVFDKHPENNRSMFGGGRYNGLADIFGVKDPIPAVWCAPGDETMKLFLESRWLINMEKLKMKKYYIPLLDESLSWDVLAEAQKLRSDGKNVEIWFELVKKMWKMYEMCEKKWVSHVVLVTDAWVEMKELSSK